MSLRGSCLCKAVCYEVDQLDMPIGALSLRDMQESSRCSLRFYSWGYAGSVSLDSGRGETLRLRVLTGEAAPLLFGLWNAVIAERPSQPHIILRVATLDDDPGVTPAMHIWTSHEPPWLTDGKEVPPYPEWEPGRQ